MDEEPVAVEAWLAAFQETAVEFAAKSMRFEDDPAPLPAAAPGGTRPGAYIAILGQGESIHLGISTTAEGVRVLTRGMLRIRDDGALTDKDAVDGLSEILNIVAGKVKSRMAPRDGVLLLGLPMFINGRIQACDGMENVGADVMLGPVPCRLEVYRREREEHRAA